MITEMLNAKFMSIVEKHGNQEWARKELEWLVYDKHRDKYESLSEEKRFEVDGYFSSLKKIHGGN